MSTFTRMRPLIVTCAALFVAAAAAVGAQKYGVTATAEKGVDFTSVKTYEWTAGRPSPDRTVDGQIMAAVDRELAALGMTRATAGHPDVFVTYYSVSRTDVDVKAKPDEKGVRPQHTVGSLVVALLHPANRKPLLRLRIDKPIETDPATAESVIGAAVAELFAKYPTKVAAK